MGTLDGFFWVVCLRLWFPQAGSCIIEFCLPDKPKISIENSYPKMIPDWSEPRESRANVPSPHSGENSHVSSSD